MVIVCTGSLKSQERYVYILTTKTLIYKVQTADTIRTDLANGYGRRVKGSNMSGQKLNGESTFKI